MRKSLTIIAATGLTLLAACKTTPDPVPGDSNAIAQVCQFQSAMTRLESIEGPIDKLETRAERLDAITAARTDLEALALNAGTVVGLSPKDELTCQTVQVEALMMLAEITDYADASTPEVVAAVDAVTAASENCPLPGEERRCSMLTEFFAPTLESRSLVAGLSFHAPTANDDSINWGQAERYSRGLDTEISSSWAVALATAKARADSGMGASGNTAFAGLRRQYHSMACETYWASGKLDAAWGAALQAGETPAYDGVNARKMLAGIPVALNLEEDVVDAEDDAAVLACKDDTTCRNKLVGQLATFCELYGQANS